MQDTIDSCGCGYSTQGAIKNLWGHLDRFAMELDIVGKCCSDLLTSDPIPETTKEIFTDEEIALLWIIKIFRGLIQFFSSFTPVIAFRK